MTGDPGTITALLSRWSDGDAEAFPELVALAYDDLRRIAHRRLRAGQSDGLATTALVHEAYLKLVGHQGGEWRGRAQFFAFASRAMRHIHILVDHGRREHAARRGGNAVRIPLDEQAVAAEEESANVLGVEGGRTAERDLGDAPSTQPAPGERGNVAASMMARPTPAAQSPWPGFHRLRPP
jgi:RNA polymerase sigma factor (TIGR02999 family)